MLFFMSTDITNKPREKGVFDNFTNLYEFSKTLTFGLIPLKWDDNKKMIVEDEDFSVLRKYGVIEEDKRIAESIKIAKFYLNILLKIAGCPNRVPTYLSSIKSNS